ncbi:MAG: MATE family efflux transporter [Bacillota bacterium]|nr:MATE family efflux transporter [Bacillota bacterium]
MAEPVIHEMSEREKELAYKPLLPLFFKQFIPAAVAMVVQSIYTIVDRIFIGNIPGYGQIAIGGVGVVMPLIFFYFAIGALFGIGGSANISLALGRRDRRHAERVLGNVFTLMLITTTAINILFLLFSRDILTLFGASETNIGYADTYFRILVVGTWWNMLSFAFNQVIRAEGNARRAMNSMLIGAFTNFILDPLFIFGLNMGVAGAAYATIIAQFLSFAYGASYFLLRKSEVPLHKDSLRPNWEIIKHIVAIGFTPFFIQAAGSLIGLVMNNSLRHYGGDLAMSAHTIMGTLTSFTIMPIIAMNQALQPIVGFNYGARNFKRVRGANIIGVAGATLFLTVIWLLAMWIPRQMASVMAKSGDLIDLGALAIRTAYYFIPLYGVQIISANFFTAIGRAKTSFWISTSRQFTVQLPLLYFLPRSFGLVGIWWAISVADLLAFGIAIAFVIKEYRHMKAEERRDLALASSVES